MRRQSPFCFDGWKQLSPSEYWKRLLTNPDASLIALVVHKLHSVVPNSMAEERTVSRFTKTNSPSRAGQKASTLVGMTKIQQAIHRREAKAKGFTAKAPVVRFCDLSKPKSTSRTVAKPPTSTATTTTTSPNGPVLPVAAQDVDHDDDWDTP
ncbi:hypothetical protein DL93DRAFT_857395 [Clavulina sp. PMI_390]|nr:hypothetical protein DL93DRAFT_857395 [Clavulina sp. PMI_390]